MKKTGEFVCLPSLNLPEGYVNGTVGAGDAFCAGVLYSLYKGYDLMKTVQTGTGSAALSLSETNPTDGVGCLEEINDIINEFGFKPEV
jgi:sugar/nucleoside kinase (ribokinase family)